MSKSKGKTNKVDKLTVTLSVIFAVVFVVMIIAVFSPAQTQKGTFTPPSFDASAVTGTPEVPDNLGYSAPFKEGMSYRFAVCGNVTMEGKQALVYFTNSTENNTWIKLRVFDAEDNKLGETGLIKPGEYVKYVELNKNLPTGTNIKLKIMGYEPETYLSAGSAILNTAIGGAKN